MSNGTSSVGSGGSVVIPSPPDISTSAPDTTAKPAPSTAGAPQQQSDNKVADNVTALKGQATEKKGDQNIAGQLRNIQLSKQLANSGPTNSGSVFSSSGIHSTKEPAGSPEAEAVALNQIEHTNNTRPQAVSRGEITGRQIISDKFAKVLEQHKNDPEWIRKFYSSLGADNAAKFISYSTNPEILQGLSVSEIDKRSQTIKDSFSTLHQSGALRDSDLRDLTYNWANPPAGFGDRFNPEIGRMFAELPAKDLSLKNSFASATAKLSTELKGEQAQAAAAAGAEALASTSADNQLKKLSDFQKQGTLGSFLSNAGAFEDVAHTKYAMSKEASGNGKLATRPYDHVSGLVTNLSLGHVRDKISPLPITNQELEATRIVAFNNLGPSAGKSVNMKDSLSRILMQDFTKIWNSGLGKNKATFDDDKGFQKNMEAFTQHALFSQPTGGLRDKTSEFLAGQMKTWNQDINDKKLSKDDFAKKYDVDRQQLSHLMGETMGMVNNGLEAAMKKAQATVDSRQAFKEAAIKYVLDLGFAMLPDLPGEDGVIKRLFGKVTGDVKDQIKGMSQEGAVKLLAKKLPDFHPDQVMAELFQELREETKGDESNDFLSALQSSYEHIDHRPAK